MSKLQVWSAKFREKEDGTIAMFFGLSVGLLFMCAGMGMDFARAHQASTMAANAIDTSALAAAKAMREDAALSDAQLLTIAQQFFDANISHAGRGITTWNPVVFSEAPNRETGTIKASVSGAVGTYFARVAGPSFEQIPLTKSSTVNFSLKDIEFGLALDVTGSMCSPCAKRDALKAAATDLVDILMPDGGTPGRKVRIGLAPYAASVRLTSAMAATVTSNKSVDGCVIERAGGAAFDDDAPAPGRWIDAKTPASPANGQYSCNGNNNSLMPLTEQSQKAALKAKINALTTGGFTAGQIGTAWAWYMISPDWQTVWNLAQPPAPYKDGKTIKAVLLMTDGEFNTSYNNGPQNSSSDTQALQLCTAMKDATRHDVVVYAVAFQSPAAAKTLLQSCASTPGAPHFFDASNEAELRAAFKNIATNLNNLRLTQ